MVVIKIFSIFHSIEFMLYFKYRLMMSEENNNNLFKTIGLWRGEPKLLRNCVDFLSGIDE